jgi:hypothetical protein
MKKYVAIESFKDLQDNNTWYTPGTIYPRGGLEVSEDRLNSLLTGSNMQGRRVIAELVEIKQEAPENVTVPDKVDGEEAEPEKKPRGRKKKDTE